MVAPTINLHEMLVSEQPLLDPAQLEEERRQAWLEERRGRFTASEIFKLFPKSLKKMSEGDTTKGYIEEKVAEKLGSYSLDVFSKHMEWGKQYEDEAVKKYIENTGLNATNYGKEQEFITKGDWAGGTPDFRVGKNGGQIKCPSSPREHLRHLQMKSYKDLLKVNYKHYAQCQMEIYICDAEWWDFVSYDPRLLGKNPDKALKIVRIEPDIAFQDLLQKSIKKASEIAEDILKGL